MSTTTGNLKLRLRIFNIILIAISALSICWLAIFPFLEVKVNYLLTADTVKEFMKDMNEEEVDIDDIVKDGINIGVGVSITPKMLVKSVTTSDPKQFVEEDVIAPTVDRIIEDLMPTIEEIAKRAVKSTAKKELTKQLEGSFKETFGADVNVEAKLSEAGINIDQELDEVITIFTAEDATVDSVSTKIAEKINTISEKVETAFPEYAGKFDGITAEQIKEPLQKALDEVGLVDEQGNILDFEQMLSVLLDKAMGETKTEETADNKPVSVDPLNRVYAEEEMTTEEQAEAAEEAESLADKVKNLIYEKLPDNIVEPISLGLKATAGVLGLFLLTWAFVGLFALLKTIFGRNPGIFTGLICFISAFLQVIIGIVLVYGLVVFQSGKITVDVVQSAMKSIPVGLSVQLVSSVTISAFCVLAKWILAPFYHSNKRRLKKRLDLE